MIMQSSIQTFPEPSISFKSFRKRFLKQRQREIRNGDMDESVKFSDIDIREAYEDNCTKLQNVG